MERLAARIAAVIVLATATAAESRVPPHPSSSFAPLWSAPTKGNSFVLGDKVLLWDGGKLAVWDLATGAPRPAPLVPAALHGGWNGFEVLGSLVLIKKFEKGVWALDASTFALRWHLPDFTGGKRQFVELDARTLLAAEESKWGSEPERLTLVWLDSNTGHELRRLELRERRFGLEHLILHRDRVLLHGVGEHRGMREEAVLAVDPRSGRRLWRHDPSASPAATGTVPEDVIVLHVAMQGLDLLDPATGRLAARIPTANVTHSDVVVTSRSDVTVVNTPGRSATTPPPGIEILTRNGRTTLQGMEILTGRILWRHPLAFDLVFEDLNAIDGRWIQTDDTLYTLTLGGCIKAIDRKTGRQVWEWGLADQEGVLQAAGRFLVVHRHHSGVTVFGRSATPLPPPERAVVSGRVLVDLMWLAKPNGPRHVPAHAGILVRINDTEVRTGPGGRFRATIAARGTVLIRAPEEVTHNRQPGWTWLTDHPVEIPLTGRGSYRTDLVVDFADRD